MKTIELTGRVTKDRKLHLRLQLPPDISPGEHRVVVIIDQRPMVDEPRGALYFPVDHYGPWPANLSLHRDDLYNDSGR